MDIKVFLLFSGGLDSIISAKLLSNMGFNVIGVHVSSPLFERNTQRLTDVAKAIGMQLLIIEAGNDYLEMLKNPIYGYGKNLNPCIDCKAYMLKKVKDIAGKNIIATGEVLGQRPMSQNLSAFKRIEKLSGLEKRILRPLSGKLLPPTLYEEKGIIDRERLLDLSGRSRKRYPQIIENLNIKIGKLPTPAGGCLLTQRSFSNKVKDLINYDELTWKNVKLLKVGRHFRINKTKLIVGRNKEENEILETLPFIKIRVVDFPGPTGIITNIKNLETAAGIVARYSDGKEMKSINAVIHGNGLTERLISVKPISGNAFMVK